MAESIISNTYSDLGANQFGGHLPYFVGKQYGSGWLGTFAKMAFPFLKKLVGIASNTAEDVIYKEKPIGEAVKDQLAKTVTNLVGSNTSINRRSVHNKRKSNSSYPLFEAKRRKTHK